MVRTGVFSQGGCTVKGMCTSACCNRLDRNAGQIGNDAELVLSCVTGLVGCAVAGFWFLPACRLASWASICRVVQLRSLGGTPCCTRAAVLPVNVLEFDLVLIMH
jgi:hypothetical protein